MLMKFLVLVLFLIAVLSVFGWIGARQGVTTPRRPRVSAREFVKCPRCGIYLPPGDPCECKNGS